jgi:hypothetical protein
VTNELAYHSSALITMTRSRKKSRFGRKRGISIKIDQMVEIPLQGVGLIAAINQRFIVNLKQKGFFLVSSFLVLSQTLTI